MGEIQLFHGDCLELMREIPSGSVDMILCDLPYGTTACKWDSVIPFAPLWEQYRRIAKPRAAIVLTANQPFTSALVTSNLAWFKYSWIWQKTRAAGFMNVKNKPLSITEDVLVFSSGTTANGSKNRMPYFPQGIRPCGKAYKRPTPNSSTHGYLRPSHRAYDGGDGYTMQNEGYPKNILAVPSEINKTVHPTQKPVALMEYLIRTYTNEGETVMDNCMGSGTTGVACANTGRNFIGIERDDTYFEVASRRINERRAEIVRANAPFALTA